jgi:2-iminobutanoate/2-iminopropanoate deaminase
MTRVIVNTPDAPAAIGPYSQAVKVGNFIYTSGQIPINPASGEVITGDTRAQTRQVLENIKAVLKAGGSSMDKVIKTTLFIRDMNSFTEINEVYGEFFPDRPPARSTVEVARLPKDVDIEIEAIAECV